MAWYVWVGIVAAAVVIGWVKVKVLKSIMAKRAEKNQSQEEED